MPDSDLRPPPAHDDLFALPLARRTDRFFAVLTVLALALLPLAGFVTLLLVVLRVTDQWGLAWVWVFAPIWGLLVLAVFSILFGFLCSSVLARSSGRGKG